MKKLISFTFGILALTACTDELVSNDIGSENTINATSDVSLTRTADEVLDIANKAVKWFGEENASLSRSKTMEISCITTKAGSRTANDTLLFVVNYGNDNGFAIISAKKDHDGLLAVTNNGTYTEGVEFDNPGMNMMMKNAIAYASIPIDPILPPVPENPKMMEWVIDTISSIDVAPRLSTAWGTDFLGEDGFPDPRVTCGPIAASQALAFLKQPSSIVLTHKNNSVLPLDWDSMIAEKYTVHYQRNLLGPEVAYRMGTFTSIDNTSNINNAKSVIDNLVPGHTSNIYHSNADLSTIRNGGIIYVSARGVDENEYSHAFIIDGGHRLYITETTYIVTYLSGTNLVLSRELKGVETLKDEYYFHVNWGWGGINNGYFNSNLLAPHKAIEYDDRVSESYYGGIYQYNQWYFTIN